MRRVLTLLLAFIVLTGCDLIVDPNPKALTDDPSDEAEEDPDDDPDAESGPSFYTFFFTLNEAAYGGEPPGRIELAGLPGILRVGSETVLSGPYSAGSHAVSLPAGEYEVYGWVDVDGDGVVGPGDLLTSGPFYGVLADYYGLLADEAEQEGNLDTAELYRGVASQYEIYESVYGMIRFPDQPGESAYQISWTYMSPTYFETG